MVSDSQMRALFRSFLSRNDEEFVRVAEAIIASELVSNKHALAEDLRRLVLGLKQRAADPGGRASLALLPKDRRSGDSLISLRESMVKRESVILEDETKVKIERLVTEHRYKARLAKHGLQPKTRILFWGPPGCGKTFTAHLIAHELSLPIGVLRLSAAISSFLGDTSSHLQRTFDMASESPMVLLLDEVDAIAKERRDDNDVGEMKRVVNALLQAMDSFRTTRSLVIAASNHQYLLDSAIWRRFDDIIYFPLPSAVGRGNQLRQLLNGVSLSPAIDLVASLTKSLSFADIERVITEAIKTMVLEERDVLSQQDIVVQLDEYKRMRRVAGTRS